MTAFASQNVTALVALMKLRGVGRRGALRMLEGTGSDPDPGSFRRSVIDNAVRAKLGKDDIIAAWSTSEGQLRDSSDAGIQAFSIYDEGYPTRLRNIPDPPAVLYVKGDLGGLSRPLSLAVVGTREPTTYGAKVARKSAASAVEAGFVIVSGLAHGCDTYGHEGCLDAGGVGIVVLAHGLDKIYPAANRDLAKRLLDHHGCLVSEYPIGVTPMKTAFAERDRIQAGLSDGVLVIETDIKGGTMHTVRFAREQRRGLACIDHPEKLRGEDKTKGNQQLIADRWAKPIPDGAALSDFLAELARAGANSGPPAPLKAQQTSLAFE